MNWNQSEIRCQTELQALARYRGHPKYDSKLQITKSANKKVQKTKCKTQGYYEFSRHPLRENTCAFKLPTWCSRNFSRLQLQLSQKNIKVTLG